MWNYLQICIQYTIYNIQYYNFMHCISGPRPWPIIGNLLDIANASSDLTQTFGNLSEKYGEIFSIKVGMKRTGWHQLARYM